MDTPKTKKSLLEIQNGLDFLDPKSRIFRLHAIELPLKMPYIYAEMKVKLLETINFIVHDVDNCYTGQVYFHFLQMSLKGQFSIPCGMQDD